MATNVDSEEKQLVINEVSEKRLAQMLEDGTLPANQLFVTEEGENIEINMKVLWTNPNPASSFTAQTVTLTSDDWDYLLITANASDSHLRTCSSVIFSKSSPNSVGANLIYSTSTSSYGPVNFIRSCNVVSTNGNPTTSYSQVYFENCYEGYNSTEISDNRNCVPNQIIGIKAVGQSTLRGTEIVETIYDMSLSDSSKNWGYTGGIPTGTSISKDFTKYKYLKFYCNRPSDEYGSTITFIPLDKPQDSGAYIGRGVIYLARFASVSSLLANTLTVSLPSSKTSINIYFTQSYNTNDYYEQGYRVYKIEGVY